MKVGRKRQVARPPIGHAVECVAERAVLGGIGIAADGLLDQPIGVVITIADGPATQFTGGQ